MNIHRIVIYTLPDCQACKATRRALDKYGLAYESINLSERPDLADQLRKQGFVQAPIIISGEHAWSGYRPDLIRSLSI